MADLSDTIFGAIKGAVLTEFTPTAADRKRVGDAIAEWLAALSVHSSPERYLSPQAVARFQRDMLRVAEVFTVEYVDGKMLVKVPEQMRVSWFIFEHGNSSMRGVGDATAWVLARAQAAV